MVESTPLTAQLEIGKLKTGSLRWSRNTFIIADYQIFSALGLEDRPMAIVSADLFSRRDFVIDFARQRLLVRTRD